MNWIPDTCGLGKNGCKVSQVIDANGTVIFGGQILNKCSNHASVPDEQLYDVLIKENRSKNLTEKYLMTLTKVADTNPDGTKIYKTGVEFNYTWVDKNGAREVVPVLKGEVLTLDDIANAKTFVETELPKII